MQAKIKFNIKLDVVEFKIIAFFIIAACNVIAIVLTTANHGGCATVLWYPQTERSGCVQSSNSILQYTLFNYYFN